MNAKTHFHPELITKTPQEVKIIFEIFGDEIRLVGGCVRDLLMGEMAKDYDFACTLLPEKIIEILGENNIQAIPTGIKFGTITAVVNHKNFEITTLRKDVETDGRHASVEFVDDYFLDASRRDFTINALYLDNKGLVYDYFDGISDLENKEVKFIGDASARISEDFLRILRFFRFNCKYAAKIDDVSLKACIDLKNNLKKLSKERIREEILKMLKIENESSLFKILQVMQEKNILSEIFSSDSDIVDLKRLFLIEKKLEFKANINLKIAAIFLKNISDLKVFFYEICATNYEKKYFEFLLNNAASTLDIEDLKMLLVFQEKELVLNLYLLTLLQNFEAIDAKTAKENIKYIENFSLPEFPLNGEDLMQLGFVGKQIGGAIKSAKEFWAKSNFSLNKADLIDFLS